LVSRERVFRRVLSEEFTKALREELTSGDGNVKALIAQLLISAILRDSAGGELSSYIKNLDTALSSRASEVTLSGIKAKTDSLTFDTAGRLAVQNPPNLDTTLSSRASEATLSSIAGQLDVKLSALSRLTRWGRDVSPAWVQGGEVTAPPANTALVSWTVPAGKTGFIYGFFISAGEGNDFRVNWTSGGVTYSRRIVFAGKGTLHFVDITALNEGLPADGGTSVTITNVNAGSAGIVYQVALLVVAV
jgi:hypothetical protein